MKKEINFLKVGLFFFLPFLLVFIGTYERAGANAIPNSLFGGIFWCFILSLIFGYRKKGESTKNQFSSEPNITPILKATITFDEENNAQVEFEKLHPELKHPEYVRLILHYYAKLLVDLDPNQFESDLTYKNLFKFTDTISNANLKANPNILQIADIDSVIKFSNPKKNSYCYIATFFAYSVTYRHMTTKIPMDLKHFAFSLPVLIQGALQYLDDSEFKTLQVAFKWMNEQYRNGFDYKNLSEWESIPYKAFFYAIKNDSINNVTESSSVIPPAASDLRIDNLNINELDTLNNKVTSLLNQGCYDRAFVVAKKALLIAEQSVGPNHPYIAKSLNNLAMLYNLQGKKELAKSLFIRSLAIREKALGPEHIDTADSLSNLALNYGNLEQAEPLLIRSLDIKEKTLGLEHPQVASSLNNLAELYKTYRKYAQAEPLIIRSLAISEKTLGPEHTDTADSLNKLAGLYNAQGHYAKAEPLFLRSLAIKEKALGPEHLSVAITLNNLGGLYYTQVQYEQAEPLFLRSLAIFEKVLGRDHYSVTTSLKTLAQLYRRTGREKDAEELEKRVAVIQAKNR